MTTFIFNQKTIDGAIAIIQSPEDSSNANKQARLLAKSHLLMVTQELTEFANLKPASLSARYLFDYCVKLRKIATQVKL